MSENNDFIDGAYGNSRMSAPGNEVSKDAARKATGSKSSDGTWVFSARIPGRLQEVVQSLAFEMRISEAEIKKAIIYQGIKSFLVDGVELDIEFDKRPVAKLPDEL